MPIRRMEIGNHFRASLVLKSRYWIRPVALQDDIAIMHTSDYARVSVPASPIGMRTTCALTCTNRRKKLRLKFVPLTTYLFATVMRIELPQYVRMDIKGLSTTVRIDAAFCCIVGGGGLGGAS